MGSVPLTLDMVWPAVGGLVTIVGVCFGIWRFFRSEVKEVDRKAEANAKELAEYKTHVAETYISKQGHRESTEQIMGAINAVRSSVDGLNTRIDNWYQNSTPPRRSRSNQE
jgi:hypothetical protein